MMKRIVCILYVCCAAGVTASADDLMPPEWRGQSGSTLQEWSFSTDNAGPVAPDDGGAGNPYGDPLLAVTASLPWLSQHSGREGIWSLPGEIDILIPNSAASGTVTYKQIYVQLTWKAASQSAFLPDQPLLGVVPDYSKDPSFYIVDTSRQDMALGDGWIHSLFAVDIWPNPAEEWIAIKGDIMIDQVVVDTLCIPEPGTLAMLGLGTLILRRRMSR